MFNMTRYIIFIFFFFLISCGDSKKEEINKTFVGEEWRQEVVIHFMSSTEIQQKCDKLKNCDSPVYGFAGTDQYGKCHIYVERPKYVNDNNTLTVGHEIMHCVDGRYHK